jgi:methylated-DNA-[protein]-cysteine S-methyltransferase
LGNRIANNAKLSYLIRSSPFGQIAILWSFFLRRSGFPKDRPKTIRVLIPKPNLTVKKQLPSLFPYATTATCSEVDTIADDIEAFLSGEDIKFSLEMVRMDVCSKFQKKVLRTEHRIPRGRVSTYHYIAGHLNNPKGARAVGNALANNPFPIIIPCHRVIRADRTLGGYQGGLEMKRTLLEIEGIEFDELGRVISTNFFFGDSKKH